MAIRNLYLLGLPRNLFHLQFNYIPGKKGDQVFQIIHSMNPAN